MSNVSYTWIVIKTKMGWHFIGTMRHWSAALVLRVAKPYLELFTLLQSTLTKRVLATNSGEIARIPVTFTCFNSIRMPFVRSLKQVDILLLVRRPIALACSSFPLLITFRGFYLSALFAGCSLVVVLTNYTLAWCIISFLPSVSSHCLILYAVKPQQPDVEITLDELMDVLVFRIMSLPTVIGEQRLLSGNFNKEAATISPLISLPYHSNAVFRAPNACSKAAFDWPNYEDTPTVCMW